MSRATGTRPVRRMRHGAWLAATLALSLPAVQAVGTSGRAVPAPSASGALGLVTVADRVELAQASDALRAGGLTVQMMQRLPILLVQGAPTDVLRTLAPTGVGSYYPDERLELFAADSNAAIGVDRLQAMGLTGKGVQVAIVDSGIDASHPDLKSRVTHNIVMTGTQRTEEVSPVDSAPDLLVRATDLGPGSNTDTGNGHGTAVAGVVAADGRSGKKYIGVAPQADLIGYAVGVISMGMAVAAYDDILAHPERGVDIVNNSFGNAKFSVFDPAHPVNVASRVLTEAGMAVVFGAANSGGGGLEMTMSQYAAAPWAIGVAASTIGGERADFSSNGLPLDNAGAALIEQGHVSFTGDRLGIYHPSVTAPGQDINTTCTQTGQIATALGCRPVDGFTTASGTSFAAPHIAGVLALLEQARPGLTPAQQKQVLEATAKQTKTPEPAWKVGYGIVNAPAALALVKSEGFPARLAKAHRDAAARVLAQRPWSVAASDLWTFRSPVVAVPQNATRTFTLAVPVGTDALKLGLTTYDPTTTAGWSVTVTDAAGRTLGRTERVGGSDIATVDAALLDLRSLKPSFGTWALTVTPQLAVNDEVEATYVEVVLHAARLRAR